MPLQIRAQIRNVETFLTSADYARHMIEMMKYVVSLALKYFEVLCGSRSLSRRYKDRLYNLHQRFMKDALAVTSKFKGADQHAMVCST